MPLNQTFHRSWLWPDHTIGKAESRMLRNEHNELVNAYADAIEALRFLVDAAATEPGMAIYRAHLNRASTVLAHADAEAR